MRKSFLLTGACMLMIWLSVSCLHFDNDNNTSISISETKREFKLDAHFSRNRTKAVHEYMDKKLAPYTTMSFVNREVDADITFDNGTTFYIKSLPGELAIKLDKEENSHESYMLIKEMCEGIKDVAK